MLDIQLQSTKVGDIVEKYKINYIVNDDMDNSNFEMITFIKNDNDKKFHVRMKCRDIYADYYEPFFKYNRILIKRAKESYMLMNGM